MSTGPEHYREAERLLAVGKDSPWDGPTAQFAQSALAAAQVHAELARVAVIANTKAIAEHPLVPRPDHFGADNDALTWKDVIR